MACSHATACYDGWCCVLVCGCWVGRVCRDRYVHMPRYCGLCAGRPSNVSCLCRLGRCALNRMLKVAVRTAAASTLGHVVHCVALPYDSGSCAATCRTPSDLHAALHCSQSSDEAGCGQVGSSMYAGDEHGCSWFCCSIRGHVFLGRAGRRAAAIVLRVNAAASELLQHPLAGVEAG